jgi:hypothetical protein
MRKFVRRLAPIAVMALAPMATVTIATPAVSWAQCDPGQYWEPFSKACLPLGQGPTPLACDPGQYWDPTTNVCRPLGEGPPGPPAPPGG